MVTLDLVELDGIRAPEALADAIFAQNPSMPVPIPVEELAELAGVSRITPLTSGDGFEGMLITNRTKSEGEIFYNARSPRQRQRFTIGHELGHMMLPSHRSDLFKCSQEDMSAYENRRDPAKQMEIEANRFSSELLMPKAVFGARARALKAPELAHVQALAGDFETSMEATARRYIALSDYACAVVFSKDRTVRYSARSRELPYFLDIKDGLALPRQAAASETGTGLGEWQSAEPWVWLEESKTRGFPSEVLEQTLFQDAGYKMTLLYVEDVPDEE